MNNKITVLVKLNVIMICDNDVAVKWRSIKYNGLHLVYKQNL